MIPGQRHSDGPTGSFHFQDGAFSYSKKTFCIRVIETLLITKSELSLLSQICFKSIRTKQNASFFIPPQHKLNDKACTPTSILVFKSHLVWKHEKHVNLARGRFSRGWSIFSRRMSWSHGILGPTPRLIAQIRLLVRDTFPPGILTPAVQTTRTDNPFSLAQESPFRQRKM